MNKNIIESNINSTINSMPVSVSVVMILSKEESQARKEAIEARNARHHIPAIQEEEKKVAIKDIAREELYAGSQLGVSIAFASLSNHRKELYARYGRYQIKTVYDSGDMMWHMYLM